MKKFKDGLLFGIGGVLGGLGIMTLAYYIAQRHIGIFSYLGMDEAQIKALAQTMDSRCQILTRACNDKGCRGIYLGGACSGIPLYYHYKKDSYELYPLLWSELWSTNKDRFGLTGRTTVY